MEKKKFDDNNFDVISNNLIIVNKQFNDLINTQSHLNPIKLICEKLISILVIKNQYFITNKFDSATINLFNKLYAIILKSIDHIEKQKIITEL